MTVGLPARSAGLGWPETAPASDGVGLGWPSARLAERDAAGEAGVIPEDGLTATHVTAQAAPGASDAVPFTSDGAAGAHAAVTGALDAASVVSDVAVGVPATVGVPDAARNGAEDMTDAAQAAYDAARVTLDATPNAETSLGSPADQHGDVSRETTTRPMAQASVSPKTSTGGSASRAASGDLPGVDDDERAFAEASADAPVSAAGVEVGVPAQRGFVLTRPGSTRVITVANQKGGVGKTTTTVNLAAALALHGAEVLVIDLDPQGNASTALGVDHHSDVPSVYDVLVEGRPLHEVVTPAEGLGTLLCAPATIDLAGAEIELVSLVARELRLQRALRSYQTWRADLNQPRLDYVFIDCPPSLGLLTINALVAAAEVLIPIQCEYYALEGVGQLVKNVDLVKAHLNPDLRVSTIVLTMYDGRTRLAAQVADEVRTHFADVVLRTTIPRSVRISEAPSYGQTVMTYDPASSGALSYLEVAREIAARNDPQHDPLPRATGAGEAPGPKETAT